MKRFWRVRVMLERLRAICEAINRRENRLAAWAKHDPTRNDLPIPENVASSFEAYRTPLRRYGKEVHAIYQPTNDRRLRCSH